MPRVKVTTEIDLSIDTAAEWFCGLDDDQMAKFLVAVAERAEQFEGSPENQWYYLGGHLRNCGCSTENAREMVRKWAHWIDHSDHGRTERESDKPRDAGVTHKPLSTGAP